jgi:glycosyltransferase involved in cell wall biosynthesis
MNQISIIMPCYNRAYDLRKTLAAYECQSGNVAFEIIAVDDGSSDSTSQELTGFTPTRFNLRPVRLEKNQGPATARNCGLELAEAPLVLFVGDDILPANDLLQKHYEAHLASPEDWVAILGCVQWPQDLPVNTLMSHINGVGAQQFSYYYFRNQKEYDFRHFYTSNISVNRDFLMSNAGGFDTSFPYAAFEDVELAYRLAKKGLKIIYNSAPVGYHYHYHTIWTFSARQYQAGLMASLLVKKHPGTGRLILGKRWLLRNLRSLGRTLIGKRDKYQIDELEFNMKLKLSFYEWTAPNLLDRFYGEALGYFFQKGLLQGFFGKSAITQKILGAEAHRVYSLLAAGLAN